MSLGDAKHFIEREQFLDRMRESGFSDEEIDRVYDGLKSSEMSGISAPFDRAHIEIVRAGAQNSHELRERSDRRLDALLDLLDRVDVAAPLPVGFWDEVRVIRATHERERSHR